MKNLILKAVTFLLLLNSCGNETIGYYKKEPLPKDLSYNITEDKSNDALEKNQLTVQISKKITIGQIATLAEKFYSSKPKQRRFYIFYLLPGMKDGSGAWATSHFDPELNIQILGSTTEQDNTATELINDVDGDIIGEWHEEQFTSSNYIILKKDNKTFIKILFKNGQSLEEELKEKKVRTGTRYDYKDDGFNGEYFVLNSDGELEFYNSKNKKFTTAGKR